MRYLFRKIFTVALLMMAGVVLAQSTKPCLVAEFDEYDFEAYLNLCKKGGLKVLVHQHPFASFGDFEWNDDFASDDEAVTRMVQKAAKADVQLGVVARTDVMSPGTLFHSDVSHLQKSGQLQLFDDFDAQDKDIAVLRTDLLKQPSSLNLILVDDELISYSTMEFSGEIILLHRCTRGAYGTEVASHSINAPTYKIMDTPDRLLVPDDMLRKTMEERLDGRLKDVGISFVLKAGDKGQELIEESQFLRHAERWAEDEDLKDKGSLGWLSIHAADKKRASTTLEEVEWLMSKAVGYGAGYGLLVNEKAKEKHGGLDRMLAVAKQWNHLNEMGVFTETQKERMRDPYSNWRLEQMSDSLYLLFPMNSSRQYRCAFKETERGLYTSDPLTWRSEEESYFALQLIAFGKDEVSNPMVSTEKSLVMFPCTLKQGEKIIYDFDGKAYLTDWNFNVIKEIVPEGASLLPEGSSEVRVMCEAKPKHQPQLIVRYMVREKPDMINISAPAKPLYAPRVLIVMYDAEVGKEPLKYAINEYGAEVIYEYNIIKGFAIRIPSDNDIEAAIKYFQEVEGVTSVEKDRLLHLD